MINKRTMIVCTLPACGKTYLFESQDKLLSYYLDNKIKFTFLDSESSILVGRKNM